MNVFCKICNKEYQKIFTEYYQSILSIGYVKCTDCENCIECGKLECECIRCYDCLELLDICNCNELNYNFEPLYEDILKKIEEKLLHKIN